MVVLDIQEEEPTFGEIVDFLQTKADETLFVMQKLRILGFSTHYHAYEVVRTSCVLISSQKYLSDYHPLHLCKSFNDHSFVSMKYRIHSSPITLT